MRKFLLVFICVAIIAFAVDARADSISLSSGDRITLANGIGSGSGGEFDAVLQEWNGSTYVDTSVEFITFCLETDEYFTPGEVLTVAGVSDTAYDGGSNTDSGDPISYATAWLYTQFWNGTLTGLNSTGASVSAIAYDDSSVHAQNAEYLQEAIWYLEDESSGVNNYYVTLATNANWANIGDVRVANLVHANGSRAQDQLFMSSPVPEPTSFALLGLGLLGMVVVRRRKRHTV